MAAAAESRRAAASIAPAVLRVETGATRLVAFLETRVAAEVDKESATAAASARSTVLAEERAGRTERERAARPQGSGANKRSLVPAVAVAG